MRRCNRGGRRIKTPSDRGGRRIAADTLPLISSPPLVIINERPLTGKMYDLMPALMWNISNRFILAGHCELTSHNVNVNLEQKL